jgi:hypothetical protein
LLKNCELAPKGSAPTWPGCCTEEALKKDLANDANKNCFEHKCGPKINYWPVNALRLVPKKSFQYEDDPDHPGWPQRELIFEYEPVWPNYDPFWECPLVLKQKDGTTFARKRVDEQAKEKCTGYKKKIVDSNRWSDELMALKTRRKFCFQKTYYEPACETGNVEYRAFNGQRLEGALHCPAGYKSNIPNDRFDSKCNCDSRDYSRNSEDNAKITLEVP